jgi:hypothetical protein
MWHMEFQLRTPRRGERVSLEGIDNVFTIFAVRRQSHVVDLRLIGAATMIMNDVPWNALVYLDEAIATY